MEHYFKDLPIGTIAMAIDFNRIIKKTANNSEYFKELPLAERPNNCIIIKDNHNKVINLIEVCGEDVLCKILK